MEANAARHSLRSERLVLVPAAPEHAKTTWPFIDDERMWEFFPALRPPTLEALRQRYERWTHEMPYLGALERWENWVCIEPDGGPVGEAQATYAGTIVYVAYAVFLPFRHHGYAREALAAVLDHARSAHGSQRAVAEIATKNEASIGVAESLGFERIRRRTDDDRGLGYSGDSYVYRLMLIGGGENSSASR
ncbi:MAG: GNAT family N-acetyltransferase [Candidatus Tyrphobacter sp.]